MTDNAHNVRGMASNLSTHAEENKSTLLTYGCASHMLNLLAHDISRLPNFQTIQQHVVQINKFFRNHQLIKAKYEENGGSALAVPVDVRWNSVCDTLKSYLLNWGVLVNVAESRTADGDFLIEANIRKFIFLIICIFQNFTQKKFSFY